MQKITPYLWFSDNAEEAMNFYVSTFRNAKAGRVTRYGENAPLPAGTVLTCDFEIDGSNFVCLNGGPTDWKFNESISFFVNCKDQAEVDEYWEKLTADGGEESQCGWLKDKYGVSWQIVPEGMDALLFQDDPKKANAAMQCMMGMRKLDLATIQKASDEA